VSDELELLRALRARDGIVDAGSVHAARTRLIAHIAEPDGRSRGGVGRWRGRGATLRVTPGAIAAAVAVGVIVVVAAVFLGLRGRSAPSPAPAAKHGKHPLVLRNLAPAPTPRLPGQLFCNAALARPGAIPGLGGAHSAVIVINAARVHGVNEAPFSLTARGLAPSSRPGEYAVWIRQVTGLSSTATPVPGAKPRLLGVITPGVGKDGRLVVEGVLPTGISGDYLIRITRQAHASKAKPGRTVLTGVGQL
jgi:hypothetical protein